MLGRARYPSLRGQVDVPGLLNKKAGSNLCVVTDSAPSAFCGSPPTSRRSLSSRAW